MLEFALGLPPEQFQRGGCSRLLMRRALRTVLPPVVCWHLKETDPARADAVRAAFVAALPTIHERLRTLSTPPTRARLAMWIWRVCSPT